MRNPNKLFDLHTLRCRSFFESESGTKVLRPVEGLAKVCLTYLGFNVFREPCLQFIRLGKRQRKYKFSTYAANFWHFHIRGQLESSPDIQDALLQAFGSQLKRTSVHEIEVDAYIDYLFFGEGLTETLLHVVARKGLAIICELLLEGR